MDPERLKIFKKTKYWKETNSVVKACVAEAESKGITINEFSRLCDLSPATVQSNLDGDIGLPQQLTLWKMCAGSGFKLEMKGRGRNELSIDSEMKGIRVALDRKVIKPRKKKKRGRKRRQT